MYIMCLSKGLEALRLSIKEGVLPNQELGFIGTAGETYSDPYFVEESRQRLRKMGISLVEIDVSNQPRDVLVRLIDEVDGLFVAGGNSFFLLKQLQSKNLTTYIAEKVRKGLPYFGESAGAVLLAESIEPAKPIDNPEDAPGLDDYRGLGLIDFFPLPHIGKEKYRTVFEKFIEDNRDAISVVQYRDDQAILTRDGSACEIIPSAIVAVE